MRFVADGACLAKRWLVQMRLVTLLGLIAMAIEADFYRRTFGQAGRLAGMWIVAIGAVASGSGVRHLCRFNLLHLLVVAGDAQRLGLGLRQHHLAIFGGGVAGITALIRKRSVQDRLHQLRRIRLMGIVAGNAVGGGKGLALVRLLKIGILGIVTIETERRGRLGQVIVKLLLARFAHFVSGMAGIAARI